MQKWLTLFPFLLRRKMSPATQHTTSAYSRALLFSSSRVSGRAAQFCQASASYTSTPKLRRGPGRASTSPGLVSDATREAFQIPHQDVLPGEADEGGPAVLRAGLEHPKRLDRFLAGQSPGVPFSFVQKLIRMRKVRIENSDGVWLRETSPGRHLEAGVRVRVHSKLFADGAEGKFLGNGSLHAPPRTKDIQRVREAVLYEDEECIVINKPSGVAVQGGSKIAAGRHLDAWMQHVVGGKEKPRLVHRLDRETSGCLVMAKTRVAASALASAFKEGRVEKMYVALVAGCIPCNSGTINAPLLKVSAPGGRDRVCCVPLSQGGLEASTRYQVLLQSAVEGEHVNLVALWPRQGRTHQLRVHCAERIGGGDSEGQCYILGDTKYGPKNRRAGPGMEEDVAACDDVADVDGVDDVVDQLVDARGRSLVSRGEVGAPTPLHGRRARLCLHALRITVRWAAASSGDRMQGGGGQQARGAAFNKVQCVAEVPEHIIACAEMMGIPRNKFNAALQPFM